MHKMDLNKGLAFTIRHIKVIILLASSFVLFTASALGFFYGVMLIINGKDLVGGILLTIFCNTVIFVMYEISKLYIFTKGTDDPETKEAYWNK
jgi:hypothetical protein